MTITTQQAKECYAKQIQAIFETSYPNWKKGLDMLFDVIQTPAFSELYPQLMENIKSVLFEKATDYNALSSFSNFLEAYLKLIDKLQGSQIRDSHTSPKLATLGTYINGLLPDTQCRDKKVLSHIECIRYIRNNMSHGEAEWKDDHAKIIQHRNSFLVAFLLATIQYEKLLKEAKEKQSCDIDRTNLKLYLDTVVHEFECWKQRFVTLQYEKINLNAREELDEQDEDSRLRRGDVECLLRNIPERQLMLLGNAGMGKTTTLQYLTLKSAEDCRKSKSTQVPVYLELKLGVSEPLPSLEGMLQKKVQEFFPNNLIDSYLEQGEFILFLDGLNEVNKDHRQRVKESIQSFIKRYPKIAMIISSREDCYFNLINGKSMPVFALQKMDKTQIHDFLAKNASKNSRELIQLLMRTSENFMSWLGVPMLFMIILKVTDELCNTYSLAEAKTKFEEVTESTNSLMSAFIREIFQREINRDMRFNSLTFQTLLSALAYGILGGEPDQDGYATISTLRMVNILKSHQQLFSDTDLSYFSDTCKGLGILVEKDGFIGFAHEEYFNYFAAKGFELN